MSLHTFVRSSHGGIAITSVVWLIRDKLRNESTAEMLIPSTREPKHEGLTTVSVMEVMPFSKGYATLKYRVFLKNAKQL
jgi:hypothetical protein